MGEINNNVPCILVLSKRLGNSTLADAPRLFFAPSPLTFTCSSTERETAMNDTRTVKVVLHPDPAKTDFVQEDAVAEAS